MEPMVVDEEEAAETGISQVSVHCKGFRGVLHLASYRVRRHSSCSVVIC
jgi:hypothetical protein